jgi:hypothetical protein
MSFVNKSLVPSGGFRYTEPASGVQFRSLSWNDLASSVRKHRIANGYPLPPGWEKELEAEVCKQYEPGTCMYVDETPNAEVRSITVSDVKNFLLVASTWMAKGGKFVEQSEAERRANICVSCSKNQEIVGCSGCNNLVSTISGVVGGRGTGQDPFLKGCAVCSCSNKAQVHLPLEILHKGVTDNMEFPEHCWKKL